MVPSYNRDPGKHIVGGEGGPRGKWGWRCRGVGMRWKGICWRGQRIWQRVYIYLEGWKGDKKDIEGFAFFK